MKPIAATRPLWLLPCVVAAVICAGTAAAQKKPETARPPSSSEVRARLVSLHAATLSSEMAGRIEAIASQVGDRVGKGDALVSFDCAMPNAQLTHAQAVLTEAARTYEISRRAAAQKTNGQLELDIPAAEVLKAKADLAAAEAAVSKCSIVAPFAGVVVERKIRVFEYARLGQAIIEMVDDRALEVELTAPPHVLGWLKPGAIFRLAIDETGKTYPGRVLRLGGRIDPASQSAKAAGEITADAPELMPGMSGHAVPAQQ